MSAIVERDRKGRSWEPSAEEIPNDLPACQAALRAARDAVQALTVERDLADENSASSQRNCGHWLDAHDKAHAALAAMTAERDQWRGWWEQVDQALRGEFRAGEACADCAARLVAEVRRLREAGTHQDAMIDDVKRRREAEARAKLAEDALAAMTAERDQWRNGNRQAQPSPAEPVVPARRVREYLEARVREKEAKAQWKAAQHERGKEDATVEEAAYRDVRGFTREARRRLAHAAKDAQQVAEPAQLR